MEKNKPGLRDYIVHAKYAMLVLLKIGWLLMRHGPFDSLRDLKRYPWLASLLSANRLMRRYTKGRTGRYREATEMMILEVVETTTELLAGIFFHPDRMIINEDMVPPEIARAMGLVPWTAELLGILLPLIDPHAMEKYIDASENEGIPPDICSLPKSTMGMALLGQMPPALAVVTSNLPCDGGMTSYEVIERELELPTFRLDIPHNFYNERAEAYFAGELRRMIAWLEEHTPGRMDWDRLREICLRRNRMAELEIELWDMLRSRPAPMAGEPVYISHLWNFNILPGRKEAVKHYEKMVEMCRRNMEEGEAALAEERYRAVLWNPPLLHVSELFNWAERSYGVALIIDSMTFNSLPPIDTQSPGSMLLGLGRCIMQGPMARHTRGPAENYFDDIFRVYRQFDLDMVWVAGHIGCKNTAALNGILRERCREQGIPLLIIEYDLSDPRIVPAEGVKEQVEHFMENVMKAGRLDGAAAGNG